MYESLPSPYGLVRFGVAPDHPEVKKSSENLDDVAKWPNFNYVGNVPIGNGAKSLPLKTIAEHYDSILFAYGASKDKKLGLPGEDLTGVHSARAFVGWYNGLPEYADLKPDLQLGDTAVILGQGNVALDVARMLLAPLDELKKTDITEAAVEALSKSKVKKVVVVGRRGPLQAPATIKELRELLMLPNAHFVSPSEGWDKHVGSQRKQLPRQLKRIVELLEKGSNTPAEHASKRWQLQYLLKPLAFHATSDASAALGSISFEQMDYALPVEAEIERIIAETKHQPDWERLPRIMNSVRALGVKGTGEQLELPASISFRSIGYLSEPLDGLEELGIVFDRQLGIIPNDINGRVLSPQAGPGNLTAAHVPGMYCAGWVKRGPTGVIASTLDDAFRTADILISDWENHVTFNEPSSNKLGWDGVRSVVDKHGIRRIDWQDWERIDAKERQAGEAKGKVREKITNVKDMLKVLDG
ncbi:hypothetical protein AMS68_006778 [Peltaster fructicola]|uniref:NADPH:adrenodoxin oxidoreductase, mitochondrial n=1 Tax=Peltaster fructicola TaxID=286661 RepID=A0A6H0Y2X3_9PEZI|nr:hypothetical protein AMS68_006778 [Peltaster fructicola]